MVIQQICAVTIIDYLCVFPQKIIMSFSENHILCLFPHIPSQFFITTPNSNSFSHVIMPHHDLPALATQFTHNYANALFKHQLSADALTLHMREYQRVAWEEEKLGDALKQFSDICKQHWVRGEITRIWQLFENGVFLLHGHRITYYSLLPLCTGHTINPDCKMPFPSGKEAEILQLFGVIISLLNQSENYGDYLSHLKKRVIQGPQMLVEECKWGQNSIGELVRRMRKGEVGSIKIAHHLIEIAREQSRLAGGICSYKREPVRRLKQSHSMTSTSMSPSLNKKRKCKKLHGNTTLFHNNSKRQSKHSSFHGGGSEVGNKFGKMKALNHTTQSFYLANTTKSRPLLQKPTNGGQNSNWYLSTDDMPNNLDELLLKKSKKAINQETNKSSFQHYDQETINHTLLLSKIQNFSNDLRPTVSFRKGQPTNEKVYDSQQLDRDLKKMQNKIQSNVYALQICKPLRKLGFVNQVFFVSESWAKEKPVERKEKLRAKERDQEISDKKYESEVEEVSLGVRKEVSRSGKEPPCRVEESKQIKKQTKRNEPNGNENKSGLNEGKKAKEQEMSHGQSNMIVCIDFLASVLGFLCKEMPSQKPRWCIAAYIVYLHYVILRYQETGEWHEKINKSLESLHTYIMKNKKMAAISNLLEKGADSILQVKVSEYLSSPGAHQLFSEALEQIQEKSLEILNLHFKNISQLLLSYKSELINKQLFKPYVKYILMLALSIRVVTKPGSTEEIERCGQSHARIDQSNQMFFNVQEELNNLNMLMQK